MGSGQEGVSEEVTLGRDSNDKKAAMERPRGGKSKVLEKEFDWQLHQVLW